MTYLTRRTHFSSAHRYFQKSFTESQNREVFGRCFTEHGHGHNYILEATLGGTPDSQTGMVINLVDVDRILKEVVDPLDHHHLNFDVAYFKDTVPTTENIARYCFDEIKKRLPQEVALAKVKLIETEDLWAEYYG